MSNGGIFEDRKTALALFLCFVLVMVYSEYVLTPVLRPSNPNVTNEQVVTTKTPGTTTTPKVATLPKRTEATTLQETPLPNQNPVAAAGSIPSEETVRGSGVIIIDTPLYRTEISKLGGRLLSFQLKNYRRELDGKEYFNFIRHQEGTPFPLGITLNGATDIELSYTMSGATEGIARTGDIFSLQGNQVLELKLTGTTSPIEKHFQFQADSYLFNLKASTEIPASDESGLELTWLKWVPEVETASSYNPVSFTLLTKTGKDEELETFPVTTPEDGPDQKISSQWVSLGDKYFMATLLSSTETGKASWTKDENIYSISLEGSKTEVDTQIYLGPKSYHKLEKLGSSLHRNVNLGFFSFLALPLLSGVSYFYSLLGNYGLAIILLTLLIKTLFLPLTQASFKSMKAMQDLQPEMKALRERVKDPTQLNQEMMGLYKRKGVNPMGGCLPMVVQIPVFFGLYSALLNSTELRHAPFALWVTDLSAPERLSVMGIGIPVMLLLMGASMFLQQYLTPSAMDPQQKKIMMFMPVVLTVMFIIIPFPSGLVLYWLVNNLISIVQQSFLRNESAIGPGKATILASIGIFALAWVVTII